jgi:hypothetical protein
LQRLRVITHRIFLKHHVEYALAYLNVTCVHIFGSSYVKVTAFNRYIADTLYAKFLKSELSGTDEAFIYDPKPNQYVHAAKLRSQDFCYQTRISDLNFLLHCRVTAKGKPEISKLPLRLFSGSSVRSARKLDRCSCRLLLRCDALQTHGNIA